MSMSNVICQIVIIIEREYVEAEYWCAEQLRIFDLLMKLVPISLNFHTIHCNTQRLELHFDME